MPQLAEPEQKYADALAAKQVISSDVMIINNAVAQEAKRNREVIGKRRRDKAVLFVKFANFSLIFIAKLPF